MMGIHCCRGAGQEVGQGWGRGEGEAGTGGYGTSMLSNKSFPL
jgi:hypothetical protein